MLTRLTVRNFKRFERAEIDLGSPVVFIGPNNSGKTSALQALALWQIGLRRWNEKRSGKKAPEKRRVVTVNRPGVTVNRRDLVAIPRPRRQPPVAGAARAERAPRRGTDVDGQCPDSTSSSKE